VCSSQWELGIVVIECRRGPGGSGMTCSAKVIKIIGDVVGVGDILIVCLMTGIAFDRRILIPVSMTCKTLQRDMRPGKRESCISVTECRRRPGSSGVALSADMIEIVGDMIRVGNILIIRLMA
jgi:hypothetical protein